MLFFNQPWIGVAERAPLTSTELAEGDEFFETIEEMESCALLQEAARDDSYAHMGQRRHLAGEHDRLQTTVVAGLRLQTGGAALQRGSSTCSSWRSSTSSRSRSSATCTSS